MDKPETPWQVSRRIQDFVNKALEDYYTKEKELRDYDGSKLRLYRVMESVAYHVAHILED